MSAPQAIDIKGNILICHEACKVIFNYDTSNPLTVKNINSTLELSQKGNSLQYNGVGDSLQPLKFNLVNVTINYPSIHFINSYMNAQWIEIILYHQTADGKTKLNVSVIYTPDDSKAAQSTLAYKLLETISKNIPDVGVVTNINVTDWYVKDIIPPNISFFTYISPSDPFTNWIVFKNYMKMPTIFLNNFKTIVAPNIKVNTTAPVNPPDLIFFGYDDSTNKKSTTGTTYNASCPSISEIRKQIENENNSKSSTSPNTSPNTSSTTTSSTPNTSSSTSSTSSTSSLASQKSEIIVNRISIDHHNQNHQCQYYNSQCR